jgi:site-specific DNA-cytosine methylase
MTRELKQFTFIDLFAGIGGFHLAFHNAGAKCVFTSEWDEFARQSNDDLGSFAEFVSSESRTTN